MNFFDTKSKFSSDSASDSSSISGMNSIHDDGSMFNVRVPSKRYQSSGQSSREYKPSRLNIQFGNISEKVKTVIPGSGRLPVKLQEYCTMEIITQAFAVIANSFTLTFIFLAVCVSVYSQLCQYYLKQGLDMTDSRAFSIPYVAAALQENAVSGLNATAWNLENSALTSLKSLSNSYASAMSNICSALNPTNTSDSMLNGLLTQIASPQTWNLSHCSPRLPHQLNQSNYGQSNVTVLMDRMKTEISTLSLLTVPMVNITTSDHKGFMSAIKSVKSTASAWIAVFSVTATLSVFVSLLFWMINRRNVIKLQKGSKEEDKSFFNHYIDIATESTQTLAKTLHSYLLKGRVNRILYIAIILALFSLSNSTVLNNSSLNDMEGKNLNQQQWLENVKQSYSQYESTFNTQLVSIIGDFIRDLNDNHLLAVKKYYDSYEFNLPFSIPFPSGVAVNVITLPMVGNRQLPYAILTPGSSIHNPSDIMHILREVTTGSWISSLLLAITWILLTILGYYFI